LDNLLRVKTFTPEELANQEFWTVLSHSDVWQHNILFHYDEKTGKPDKLAICEFLITNEQSPMNDLAYFFYLSSNHSTRSKIPQLLQIYHEKFLQIVKTYNVDLPKGFEDFKKFTKIFRPFRYFGFINAVLWFPLIFDKDGKKPEETENGKNMEDFMRIWDNTDCAEGRLGEWLVELAKELYEDGII